MPLDSQEKKGKFHGHLGSLINIVHRVCQKLPAGSVNGNVTVRCPTEEEGVEWTSLQIICFLMASRIVIAGRENSDRTFARPSPAPSQYANGPPLSIRHR
jgi:hypothetical protein